MRNLVRALKGSKAVIEDEINSGGPSATAMSISRDYGCESFGSGYFGFNFQNGDTYRSSMILLKSKSHERLIGIPEYLGVKNYSIEPINISLNNRIGRYDVVLSGGRPLAFAGPGGLAVMLEMDDEDIDVLSYVAEKLGISEFPSAFREFVKNLEALDGIKPVDVHL